MKGIFTLLFFFSFRLPCFAQTVILGEKETLAQPVPLYLNHIQVYADETNKLNAEQAAQRIFYPFSHYFSKIPDHLPPDKTWWLKLEIETPYVYDTTVVFYTGFQNYVHVYYTDSGRFTPVSHCGNMLPASQLSIPQFRQAAYLPLVAGRLNTFYISIYNRTTYHTNALKPYLMSRASLDDIQLKSFLKNRGPDFIYMIVLGMFLIIIVYLLIKWIYIKDSAYFYYALSLFGGGIFYLSSFIETGNNMLFLKEKPHLVYMLSDAFAFLSVFGYWQFVRKFLYIDREKPALGRYMKTVAAIIILFMLFSHIRVFVTGDISGYVKMNTLVGLVYLIAGLYVLTGIRKLNQPLRRIIYGGVFITIMFYSLATLYEMLRGTRYEIFSWLEGGATVMMLGNIFQMLFFTIGLAYRNKLESQAVADFKIQKSEAEMKALRAQMNPHFIFNCMNTIDAYIFKEQPEKASAFLNTFSKLIRQTLENSQQPFIALKKELESLQLFIKLEQERFDNSFEVEYHFPDNLLQYKIPPMLIQPFAENAVLHGLRHKKNGNGVLSVSASEDNDRIKINVRDNGIGRAASLQLKQLNGKPHQSMAIELTQQRLSFFKNEMGVSPVEVIDHIGESKNGTEIIITLPKIN